MESYRYLTSPTSNTDDGHRQALRATQKELLEEKKRMEAQGYVKRTQNISYGKFAYWWVKK